ncbi:DUF2797 domain-containing protein [Amycolatopsis saalfeldensis]|uniref:DUF2797 domain-containing protein n=1 Tax=Amycolatopsis saalfeldensis TaxID=394193 RepID=A0A1H8Y8G5_9PSEU|nr:DUF2797 domain-containing protein [Amycolatopsis saalfeldensis]SEP48356.1 Protein of unknown function [Amycolatopsis saalfeldensis]
MYAYRIQSVTTLAALSDLFSGDLQTEERWLLLGVEWHSREPRLRVGKASLAQSQLVTADVVPNVARASARVCCGWYDVSKPDLHVTCDAWRPARTGQCEQCARREGFRSVHLATELSKDISHHVQRYLSQPHLLYIATFPGGTTKVGTVAAERVPARLDEQGPVAAAYVAEASDGFVVRRAEAELASALSLPKVVRTARKIAGLRESVKPNASRKILAELLDNSAALLQRTVEAAGAVHINPPRPWSVPASTAAAFDETPVQLATGQFSGRVAGLAGSLVISRPVAGKPARCIDVGALRGRPLLDRPEEVDVRQTLF